MAGVPWLGPWVTLRTRAGGPLRIRWIREGGTIGVAGVLGWPSVERGDLRARLLDDRTQPNDQLAHDQRGLFPTGGLERRPCWQWDIGHHWSPLVSCRGRCNPWSP